MQALDNVLKISSKLNCFYLQTRLTALRQNLVYSYDKFARLNENILR